ncbi:MAG: ribosome biogenesis GTPase Der [Pseudomonadota bacterium]
MKPVIAIVGRPNVGKSTFFNILTGTRDALVADRPGVTRDRQYGILRHESKSCLIIDTGGIGEDEHDSQQVADLMTQQALIAAAEADALIWLVDGRIGLTSIDESLAITFRKLDKPVFLAVNKLEGQEGSIGTSEFFKLGIESVFAISAKRGDGIQQLTTELLALFPDNEIDIATEDKHKIRLAVLGRPNVGKSTLVNRIIGEDRVLTFDHPGTTRDSIAIPFSRNEQEFLLIDTAGVRRKSRIDDVVEKFSVIKSFDAIEKAEIMILVVDASEAITEQDASLLGMIENSGKPLIIAINKWDGLEESQKERVKAQLSLKFGFIDYALIHYISALHGTGVGKLFDSIKKINQSLILDASTSDMTTILEAAIAANPPMMIRGRRIKLRYAHLGGHNPLRVIIHGNQTNSIPNSYQRYLAKFFRKQLGLIGTPVLIEFKQGENPYKGKKNKLTQRQINKRKRLMKFVKR